MGSTCLEDNINSRRHVCTCYTIEICGYKNENYNLCNDS